MRAATRCCERHLWRRRTLVLLIALAWFRSGAVAGDSDAAASPAQAAAATCRRAANFRTVIDVGHTVEVPGAISARGATEYDFNLRLAREIDKDLRAAGFDNTVLMITAEAPAPGLFKRAAHANDLKADLLFSVHHDAVPEQFLETWTFEGQEQHFSDRFPGHSLFISNDNADRAGSLAFARALGNALEARGLHYTPHYTEKFMGNRRRELIDPKAGVYRYDQLIVLKETRMPAVLLEAGSIVNRNEELVLATPERQALVGAAVVEAVDGFCAARSKQNRAPVVAKKR
jgi:N-acetylmuramoyl-L-alanine amidase